jgi:antitoxin (DNA-binding transcriptional repressor) of toxin-antitoxin stability system
MSTVTLEEAQARLPELVAGLKPGEEVVITCAEAPVARLVGESKPAAQQRRLGTMKGTVIHVAPDFDAPLDDFKDHMA